MSEPKPIASLTPTLLARKGSARPAMRPQLAPLPQLQEATARQIDDLGWNDMGHEPAEAPVQEAEVVRLSVQTDDEPRISEVLRRRAKAAVRLERPRRSALAQGRKAAFTLRLDAERHLKLRLACTLANRSAQQPVTEALDEMLAGIPEVATLADQVKKRG
jgi:hypothetical protein